MRIEDLERGECFRQVKVVWILRKVKGVEVPVLRLVDPLNFHQGKTSAVHACWLALDIVIIVKDLEFVITHIGRGFNSWLR